MTMHDRPLLLACIIGLGLLPACYPLSKLIGDTLDTDPEITGGDDSTSVTAGTSQGGSTTSGGTSGGATMSPTATTTSGHVETSSPPNPPDTWEGPGGDSSSTNGGDSTTTGDGDTLGTVSLTDDEATDGWFGTLCVDLVCTADQYCSIFNPGQMDLDPVYSCQPVPRRCELDTTCACLTQDSPGCQCVDGQSNIPVVTCNAP